MKTRTKINLDLPDVANGNGVISAVPINWVGMRKLEIPVLDHDKAGKQCLVPASVAVEVSLDKADQRGIHMSRLYTLLRDRLTSEVLDSEHLHELLIDLRDSQKGLSRNIRLEISYEKWLKHPALVSSEWGWRRYPVSLRVEEKSGQFGIRYGFKILYSSTCPASAALAKNDWVQRLRQEFTAEEGDSQFGSHEGKNAEGVYPWTKEAVIQWIESEATGLATPHAQRSWAHIELEFGAQNARDNWSDWIYLAEKLLGTPVQTAVRREDEQEFARLNGRNNMFCEDAVRKLFVGFRALSDLTSLKVKVAHLESLHPHDAVAEISWP